MQAPIRRIDVDPEGLHSWETQVTVTGRDADRVSPFSYTSFTTESYKATRRGQ